MDRLSWDQEFFGELQLNKKASPKRYLSLCTPRQACWQLAASKISDKSAICCDSFGTQKWYVRHDRNEAHEAYALLLRTQQAAGLSDFLLISRKWLPCKSSLSHLFTNWSYI